MKTLPAMTCPHCPFTTSGPAALANHIKSKHPEHFIRKGAKGEKKKGGRPKGSKNKRKPTPQTFEPIAVPTVGIVAYCPRCGLDLQAIQSAMEAVGADNALASRVIDRLRTLKGNP